MKISEISMTELIFRKKENAEISILGRSLKLLNFNYCRSDSEPEAIQQDSRCNVVMHKCKRRAVPCDVEFENLPLGNLMFLKLAYLPSKLRFSGKYLF